MLRHKTKTRPGLVALYDIRPGNGAGPFLQPRSPHGAVPRMFPNVAAVIRKQETSFFPQNNQKTLKLHHLL